MRGIAMGIAEIIPGVSGGTIAFITGIYTELLETIARFGPDSAVMLWRQGPRAFAVTHNLGFIAVLLLGMMTSFVLFAGVVSGLLASLPTLVWAFFFGLIAASVVDLARENVPGHLLSTGVLGLVLGLAVAVMDFAPVDAGAAWFLVGGMLAICAWLLPGVSGGYVLLLLGLYPLVIAALATLDLTVLAPLALGCALGLSVFARGLAWLMRRYYFPAMALFTGFMAGSLVSLWPWHVRGPLFDSARQFDLPVWPATHAMLTGADPMVVPAFAAAAAGAIAVLVLSWFKPNRQRRGD
ncbi:MAG: DUF368 domain-containing protein [Gammaproteobacteria bacterium]|nr:DUF368 domain-containing protein [Gammaproteobacteria bacterium]